MRGLGGADEAVIGAAHPVGHLAEFRGGAVDVVAWADPGLGRRLLDLEAVLVRTGGEQYVVAVQPVEAGDGVGGDHLVGVADMRRAIRIGDRRREAEGLAGGGPSVTLASADRGALSSLRAARSNPGRATLGEVTLPLDCFAALAMTERVAQHGRCASRSVTPPGSGRRRATGRRAGDRGCRSRPPGAAGELLTHLHERRKAGDRLPLPPVELGGDEAQHRVARRGEPLLAIAPGQVSASFSTRPQSGVAERASRVSTSATSPAVTGSTRPSARPTEPSERPTARASADSSGCTKGGGRARTALATSPIRERSQDQRPAAGADRREEPTRLVGEDQEEGAGRRLLQHLEQRVGGVGVEVLGAVQHADPPAGIGGCGGEQVEGLAHHVDGDLGRQGLGALPPVAAECHEVRVREPGHLPVDRMVV